MFDVLPAGLESAAYYKLVVQALQDSFCDEYVAKGVEEHLGFTFTGGSNSAQAQFYYRLYKPGPRKPVIVRIG